VYNVFWIRFANIPFALWRLDEYQRHFTVMNYVDAPLTQMAWEEFVARFEPMHNLRWADVRARIDAMLGAALRAAAPRLHDNRAVALYGADVMLDEAMQPRLLEMNFGPDCTRACKYHPFFWNDVFHMLFSADGPARAQGGWTAL
jgi:hypothetical protein